MPCPSIFICQLKFLLREVRREEVNDEEGRLTWL